MFENRDMVFLGSAILFVGAGLYHLYGLIASLADPNLAAFHAAFVVIDPVTAYLLYLNDVVTDETFELSKENFASVRLPNEENFFMDDREQEAHYAAKAEPCMTDCKPSVEITQRARVLDVTPDSGDDEQGVGAVD